MTTKNGDLPAMPFTQEPFPIEAISENFGAVAAGLSKRELFAAMAMQGLLSCGATYKGSTTNRDLLARDAISHADTLLAELERTK